MSFSSEQRNSIINQPYKSSCCRKAFLCGVLSAKGYEDEGVCKISAEKLEYLEFISRFVSEFYGSKPEISTDLIGGRRFVLSFKSNSALNYIRNLNENNMINAKCELCASAFIKGAFLVSGRMADPKIQYSLEFSVGSRCELFSSYFTTLGILPRISKKPSERVVYFKNSNEIEDFCAIAGLNKALFATMDAKVEGEIRKNAMRVANCETNNIMRAVNAAKPQLAIIGELYKNDLLSLLPDELEATARLRLEYPDLSLAQLAAIAVPAISKPGLSHRLKKIVELGEQILNNHRNVEEA